MREGYQPTVTITVKAATTFSIRYLRTIQILFDIKKLLDFRFDE